MNKRTTILAITIISIVMISATTITLVIVFYPRDSDNQQEITAEVLLENVFQANSTQELGQYFSFSFKAQVSMEYLLYAIERFKVHYGEFQEVQTFKTINTNYYYQAVMENGNITGTIDLTIGNLINIFYLSFGPFFEPYLSSFTLADLTEEFMDFPDGGEKSLLISRNGAMLANYSAIGKQSVGSIFKLYVLYALQEKITSDPLLNWDTEIPIIDKLKSLPSGIMHTWTNGTMASLETFAQYMIQISDNTATDHLIHFLGRTYIENFLPVNYSLPFLKTVDMFKLRYLVSNGDLLSYLAMNVSEKRTYLDEAVYELDINDIYSIPALDEWENIAVEKNVEWFFTATEIAQVLDEVKELEATHLNPGVALIEQWSTVAFKGGANIGVYTLAHALQAENGSWFTVILFVNNYVKPTMDYYVNLELDVQILCAKLLMFLARE